MLLSLTRENNVFAPKAFLISPSDVIISDVQKRVQRIYVICMNCMNKFWDLEDDSLFWSSDNFQVVEAVFTCNV